ncbi:hypothetical protein [Streptomyces sp. NBC_01431]|uniref:hypothetical protein n=1 Tax=Streptomyces sp. NBC_01431 TaxID=2903863 RepID=UPI002E37EE1F|nr:hypothetical protein [Streptomyces sp. NBC_01431]
MSESGPGHERLGELCRRLMATPAELTADETMRRLVDHILTEVRAGRPPEELEDRFDEVEELLLAAGHSAGLGSYRTISGSYHPLPRAGNGHPTLYVLACPLSQCARVEAPAVDADRPPRCLVFGQPLRELPLRPRPPSSPRSAAGSPNAGSRSWRFPV